MAYPEQRTRQERTKTSEDVNLDKNYKDKELITSIEKDDQDFADEDLDFHESLMKEIIEDKVKEIVDKKVKEHFPIEGVDDNKSDPAPKLVSLHHTHALVDVPVIEQTQNNACIVR